MCHDESIRENVNINNSNRKLIMNLLIQGKKIFQIVIALGLFLLAVPAIADVKLPGVFESNMVLQRNKPVYIWGWANPGETITIQFNNQSKSTKAGKKGSWNLDFSEMKAGGPYEMVVSGENKILLSNILIGDIWLCGGQSNMQWRLDQTDYHEEDTAWLNKAPVRLFTVHVETDYMPKADVSGSGWKNLTQDNIKGFSAVAYHFGKFINRELNVPIGLISVNLGATSIETWMSNDALMKFPQFENVIGEVVRNGKNFETLRSEFEAKKTKWYDRHYFKGKGVEGKWYLAETDISDWKSIKIAGNTWENEPDLKDHDGAVWFRTTFDLPENYTQEEFQLALSQIDDYDITWINGVKVGETYGRHNHRTYSIPTSQLKQKGNVLTIRVFDLGGIGGFTTNAFWGNNILWGDWKYQKGLAIDARKFPAVNVPNVTPFSSPGVLYNGSIAPLTPMAIKGVIWYQGESNADRAYEYRKLFPSLIKDWRANFKQGDFPFLFVQLANYMEETKVPQDDSWAELREAQAMSLSQPKTGMATAIDIGEAADIHPKNKAEVGERLGLVALKVAYERDIVYSGPTYKNMEISDSSIIVHFENRGSGLQTTDKHGYVRGFQIAGSDKKFYWAKATIEGETVVISSDKVKDPVAVRYAWSSNPGALNLYNKEGLPAVPFRTDTWDGVTKDEVFEEGPRF